MKPLEKVELAALLLSINIKALFAAPPEALAHSPSQMPLICPVAPASQRELHKVAGRARAARAPKAKSCAASCGMSFATSSVTHPAPRPSRAPPSHVALGQGGGLHACVGRGFRRWKIARATMNRVLVIPVIVLVAGLLVGIPRLLCDHGLPLLTLL